MQAEAYGLRIRDLHERDHNPFMALLGGHEHWRGPITAGQVGIALGLQIEGSVSARVGSSASHREGGTGVCPGGALGRWRVEGGWGWGYARSTRGCDEVWEGVCGGDIGEGYRGRVLGGEGWG